MPSSTERKAGTLPAWHGYLIVGALWVRYMREYYYLIELDKSPYALSLQDALHLCSCRAMPLHVFIQHETNLTDTETLDSKNERGFYLRVPSSFGSELEKSIASGYSSGLVCKLEFGYKDSRYWDDMPPMGDATYAQLNLGDGTLVSADQLVCWTDDLEHLVNRGRIQKREARPTYTATPDSARQNAVQATTDDESEIKRLQRTVAALALGLAAKPGTYNKAGRPNVSQLAKLATEHLRDATSDRTPPGFSDTIVRNTITAALKACPELKG